MYKNIFFHSSLFFHMTGETCICSMRNRYFTSKETLGISASSYEVTSKIHTQILLPRVSIAT